MFQFDFLISLLFQTKVKKLFNLWITVTPQPQRLVMHDNNFST